MSVSQLAISPAGGLEPGKRQPLDVGVEGHTSLQPQRDARRERVKVEWLRNGGLVGVR